MKKIASVLLVLILATGMFWASAAAPEPVVTSDEGGQIMPRYTGISSFSGKLDASGYTATINAEMTVYQGYTGLITAVLQERAPGGDWANIATYTAPSSAYGICNISGQTHWAWPGNSYRVYFTFTAYSSNGAVVDNQTRYSSVQIA